MATMISSGVEEHKISTADALWALIQGQAKSVKKVLIKRLLEETSKTEEQEAMVKKSLTQAFEELYSSQIKHDARSLFQKSDS